MMNRRSCSLLSALMIAGCGDSGDTICTAVTSGMEAKSVANSLTLPIDHTKFAYDLNGDTRLDNALGNIISAIKGAAMNLDPQNTVDMSVAAGSVVLLFDETAADLNETSCGQVTVSAGMKSAMPPLFNGTDTFVVDP